MRRSWVVSSLALALALGGGCKPGTGSREPGSGPGTTEVQEEDGLSTIARPDPSDPSISYIVWFQVGSQDDPPGKEGLAYVTAQLIANGGTQQRSYQEILAALFPMAARYDVRVDREMTTLSGRTHRDTRAAFQELLTQAYLSPAFSESDFERIRQDALAQVERSLRYAQDEELGKAVLYGAIFADHPYQHPEYGTVAGLSAITLDDVRNFYRGHYTQDRLVFALAGGFDEAAQRALEATRAQLPERGEVKLLPHVPAPIRGRHATIVDKPGADASISFGFPIDVHRGDEDYYALWIANSWLGEHRNSSSHLYEVIRAARGLNYGDYSYIEAFLQGGFRQMPPNNIGRRSQIFEVWIRTLPNEHAHFALRAAMREVQTLVDRGLTAEQFELTRAFLSKYVLHYADTAMDRLGYAVDDRFYGQRESHLAKFREKMAELTVDDVNAAIKKHLQTENMHIAIVSGEAEQLKKALVEDGASTVKYSSPKPDAVLKEDELINGYPLRIAAENVRVVPVDQVFAQ